MGKTREVTSEQLDLVMAAVKKLFIRNSDGARDADELRSRFYYDYMAGCFRGRWCNMCMGIELDGYTHS